MGWSPSETALLRQMIAEGAPYGAIATRLGKGRGAICAKVHRLGIGTGRPQARLAAPRAQAAQSNAALTGLVQEVLAEHQAIAAVATLKTLDDIGDQECRFPFGDPAQAKAIYCGQRVVPGLSYCPSCARRVYNLVETTDGAQDEAAGSSAELAEVYA